MRSAEEWAAYCHKEQHWIAWSAGQGGAENILCISCARAYARECVEAWREKVEQVIPTNWADPLLSGERTALRGTGFWGCPDVERLLRAITIALRALPVETL